MLSPKIRDKFIDKLTLLNIKYSLQLNDVSYYVKQQFESNRRQRSANYFDYNKYNDLDKINTWMDMFVLENSDFVRVFEITKSFEGRSVRAFRISTDFKKDKAAIWIDGE